MWQKPLMLGTKELKWQRSKAGAQFTSPFSNLICINDKIWLASFQSSQEVYSSPRQYWINVTKTSQFKCYQLMTEACNLCNLFIYYTCSNMSLLVHYSHTPTQSTTYLNLLLIQGGAKRTHVFQIIVTLLIFNIKKLCQHQNNL